MCPQKLHTTLGLCAGVALEFLPPVTAARLYNKDKYLEPMFGDAGQARTNDAMLLLMIETTSSHTCTKPIVVRCFFTLRPFQVYDMENLCQYKKFQVNLNLRYLLRHKAYGFSF